MLKQKDKEEEEQRGEDERHNAGCDLPWGTGIGRTKGKHEEQHRGDDKQEV